MTLTVLHASDFHMREQEGDPLHFAHDIRQLFVFDAEHMAKSLGAPTVLIFSGDIGFNGQAQQYDVAREMFTNILKKLDLREQRVLVVPGNHDIDRKLASGLDARMLRDRLRSSSEQESEAEFVAKREELLEPLSAYQEFAMAYDCLIQGENGYWEIDNHHGSSASEYLAADFDLLIRGISTVHVSDRNDDQMESLENPRDFGSHMYVARGQLSCDPVTAETPFRIVVGHHPPSWWRFSEERMNLSQSRYHLHLFGHEHQFSPRAAGNAVSVRAGAINPDNIRSEQARYNWIKIAPRDDAYLIRIWSRVFDLEKQAFVEDPDWPGGQGLSVAQKLDRAVILVDASAKLEDGISPMVAKEPIPSKLMDQESIGAEESNADASQQTPPTAHAVRFALFSQHHARYSQVFKSLGFEPSEEQQFTLGGLEYYEEVVEGLLKPENIGKLLAAMKNEGIDVE